MARVRVCTHHERPSTVARSRGMWVPSMGAAHPGNPSKANAWRFAANSSDPPSGPAFSRGPRLRLRPSRSSPTSNTIPPCWPPPPPRSTTTSQGGTAGDCCHAHLWPKPRKRDGFHGHTHQIGCFQTPTHTMQACGADNGGCARRGPHTKRPAANRAMVVGPHRI